jgi:hypothetical protein
MWRCLGREYSQSRGYPGGNANWNGYGRWNHFGERYAGRTAVTMDLSIRLGEAFSLSPDFFSKAQLQRDLWEASQRKRRKIKPLAA